MRISISLCLIWILVATAVGQPLPPRRVGPGLGNLTYNPSELFTPVWFLHMDDYVKPSDYGLQVPNGHFGFNVVSMCNGYLIALFAPDSGRAPGGWIIIDVSNPRAAKVEKIVFDHTGITGEFRESHALGFIRHPDGRDYVAIHSGRGIEIWDFTDPLDPRQTSKLALPAVNFGDYSNVAWQLFWQFPYLYVAGQNNGIYIVDTRDVANPVLADRGGLPNPIPTSQLGGFRVGPIFALGNELIISSADNTAGYAVLDIGDPLHPQMLDSIPGPGARYYAISTDGKYIFGSMRNAGARMYVHDISDPTDIRFVDNSIVIDNQLYNATQDEFVFQGCQAEVVKINVAQPGSYAIVGRGGLNISNPDLGQVTPMGNLMFVGNDHGSGSALMPHQAAPDTRGPEMIITSPRNGATDRSTLSRIGISFSDNIEVATITSQTITVRKPGGPPLAGYYSAQYGKVNFTPALPLDPLTTYEVAVAAGGVTDWNGNPIAAGHSFTFSTGLAEPLQTGAGGLVHEWPLATHAQDIGPNQNHLTLAGGATIGSGALALDGIDDAAIANEPLLASLGGDASLVFRIKTLQTGSDNMTLAPALAGILPAAGPGLVWGWLNEAGQLRFTGATGSGAGSGFPINDNEWHHVVLARDASTGRLEVFIDGESRGAFNGAPGLITPGIDRFGRTTPPGAGAFLAASIKDMRIYDHPLTAAEVGTLFRGDLVDRWLLNGNTDSLSGTRDGVLQGGATVSAAGLQLNGAAGSRMDVGSDLAPYLGQSATLAFTLSTAQSGSDTRWQAPGVTGGEHVGGDNDIFWGFIDAAGRLAFAAGNGAIVRTSQPVNDGIRRAYAATRDMETGEFRIYINGQLDASGISASGARTTPFQYFGHIANNAGAANHLAGELRNIQIYGRVLSAAEITATIESLAVSLELPPIRAGSPVWFSGSATGPGTIEYSWDFGDGGPQTNFNQNPLTLYVFQRPGHYPVTLHARNNLGQTGSVTRTQTVYLDTPQAGARRAGAMHLAGDDLFAVNPDADTVTRINAATLQKVWEAPVGDNPQSVDRDAEGNLWVACHDADSLAVIDAQTGEKVRTVLLPRGSAPQQVLFAPGDGRPLVVLAGSGTLARLDPATGLIAGQLALGGKPRGLAVNADGTRAWVTRFVSPESGGEVYEIDLALFSPARVLTLAPDTLSLDSDSNARGLPNYLGSVTLAPDGLRLFVPSKKDNIYRGEMRDGRPLTFETTVRSIVTPLQLAAGPIDFTAAADLNNRGLPIAVECSPLGDYLFVATHASNTVEILDSYSGAHLGTIELAGLAPLDLRLQPGGRLFVMNYMTRGVEAHDVSSVLQGASLFTHAVATIPTVATEPLAPAVLLGKKVFHDSRDDRMSKDNYFSCVVCHFDGGSDGRTWDFTSRGEGLRNTTSLRGQANLTGRFHWTANFDEIQDFEHDIRSGQSGNGFMADAIFNTGERNDPLGGFKAGLSPELDALNAYVESLAAAPKSPHRHADGAHTAAALAGRELFIQRGCVDCHEGQRYTDSGRVLVHAPSRVRTDPVTSGGRAPQGLDTPALLELWQSAPYLHDGSAATLYQVLTVHPNPPAALTPTQRDQLVAFLVQIESGDGVEKNGAPATEWTLYE